MKNGILQASTENRGIKLDPRTKIVLLLTVSAFVLGGAGGEKTIYFLPVLSAIPAILLLASKKYKTAFVYILVYSLSFFAQIAIVPITSGIINFLILGSVGILSRFWPSIMMGMYVVSTTTVSEFTAAMQRIHLSEKIIIPMSVMFRLFPTISDEFNAINAAMRMRGISFGGKNWTKIIEYRFIPLLTCSVQIGNELSAAALTRGLGGDVKRTNVCKIGIHLQDIIALLLCILPFAFLLLTRIGVI